MKLKRTASLGVIAVAAVTVPLALTLSSHADEDAQAVAFEAQEGDFYVDPESNPAQWVRDNPDDPDADLISAEIAEQAGASWYGTQNDDPWDNPPVEEYVADAAEAGQIPILVAYNMYDRDCSGGHSDGGASSPETYKTWIAEFAADVGGAEAIIVLEPDALADYLECDDLDQEVRAELMAYAVDQFAASAPNASVYLDAGNSSWPGSAADVAAALSEAGVDRISGFALNVANHYTVEESVERGEDVNAELAGESGFVVDTSRNGAGKTDDGDDGWCNPVGATLGETSQFSDGPADALLWIKVPGDSDGDCNYGEGIPAGEFSAKLATALITGEYD